MAERNPAVSKCTESEMGMKAVRQQAGPNIERPLNTPADHILFLQRTVGNRAVESLFRSDAIQAKLEVGRPDDIYEQEADRVAEQVMRMTDPAVQRGPLSVSPLAKQENPGNGETLQAKNHSADVPLVTPETEPSINSLKGGGEPLDAQTLAFFESRFQQDFSGVRIHADANAAHSAQAVKAKAFTYGNSIVFGSGHYAPSTEQGRTLLAHELAHVVQQNNASSSERMLSRKADEVGVEIPPGRRPLLPQFHEGKVKAVDLIKREIGLPPEHRLTDQDIAAWWSPEKEKELINKLVESYEIWLKADDRIKTEQWESEKKKGFLHLMFSSGIPPYDPLFRPGGFGPYKIQLFKNRLERISWIYKNTSPAKRILRIVREYIEEVTGLADQRSILASGIAGAAGNLSVYSRGFTGLVAGTPPPGITSMAQKPSSPPGPGGTGGGNSGANNFGYKIINSNPASGETTAIGYNPKTDQYWVVRFNQESRTGTAFNPSTGETVNISGNGISAAPKQMSEAGMTAAQTGQLQSIVKFPQPASGLASSPVFPFPVSVMQNYPWLKTQPSLPTPADWITQIQKGTFDTGTSMIIFDGADRTSMLGALLFSLEAEIPAKDIRQVKTLTGIQRLILNLHGSVREGETGASYVVGGPKYGRLEPEQLADLLINRLEFRGTEVILKSCLTGVSAIGEKAYATRLWNAFYQYGYRISVVSPDGYSVTYLRIKHGHVGELPRVQPPTAGPETEPYPLGFGWRTEKNIFLPGETKSLINNLFGFLGGENTGFRIKICNDSTMIETPVTVTNVGMMVNMQGGAWTDPVEKIIWIHEKIINKDGIVRRGGSKLNLRQVIAHEIGHAMGETKCSMASRRGAELPGLTQAEREGLLRDADQIVSNTPVPK